MKLLKTITGILFLITLAGLSAYTLEEKWKTFSNAEYSIAYPASWSVYDSELSVKILSPLEYSNDTFKENVSVKEEALSEKKADLDDFSEKSEKVLSKSIDHLVIVSHQRLKDEYGEYHEVVFVGDAKDLRGKWIQHYRIKNNIAYIITLTCREKTFNKYKDIGLRILKSFRLL
jgi:hypothetical protein